MYVCCCYGRRQKYYFWESVLTLQTLVLVIIAVFGRALPTYQQALLLLCGFLLVSMANMSCAPVRFRLLVVMVRAAPRV